MQQRLLKVFLSYAHEDRKIVMYVYERLKEEGFNPWMDVENLRGGQEWTSEIEKAIKNSDVVIVFLSAKSINKQGFVQREIRRSLEVAEDRPANAIFLIPAKLDNSPIPRVLRDLKSVYFSSEDFWDKLLGALKTREAQIYGNKKALRQLEDTEKYLISNRAPALEPILERDRKQSKRRIFIAMPFSDDMEDIYYYGIQRAIDVAGYDCYRSDKNAFVGDILQEIKSQLGKSVAVVADLTNANPNVYLEVGYAWGNKKPTILIVKQGDKPKFDVQGQKYLIYKSIKHLEEILTKELLELKAHGIIH